MAGKTKLSTSRSLFIELPFRFDKRGILRLIILILWTDDSERLRLISREGSETSAGFHNQAICHAGKITRDSLPVINAAFYSEKQRRARLFLS
jgi:hypothetical protein